MGDDSLSTDDGSSEAEPFNLQIPPDEIAAINQHLQNNLQELLHIPSVRNLLTALRIQKLRPEDIRTFDNISSAAVNNVVDYNVEGLFKMWSLGRPSRLIGPLANIGYVRTHISTMSVLSVGPRTESEIFALISAGFNPKLIRGLDLVSYSPFIDLGDMHDMPYAGDRFDVVILGSVLAYSTDNQRVALEVLRVAKPGAFVAVGCEYNPHSHEEVALTLAESVKSPIGDDATRFDNTDQILDLFESHVDTVLYRDDVHSSLRDQVGNIFVIFQLKP